MYVSLLRKLQANPQQNEEHKTEEEKIQKFKGWLKENGVDFPHKLELVKTEKEGYGYFAQEDINQNDVLLKVPAKLTMSIEGALEDPKLAALRKDPFMVNYGLLVQLVVHKRDPNSFWKPYLDILPSSFSIPLFWSLEDIILACNSYTLLGSTLFSFHRFMFDSFILTYI